MGLAAATGSQMGWPFQLQGMHCIGCDSHGVATGQLFSRPRKAGVGLCWVQEVKCRSLIALIPLGHCWVSGKVGDTATVVGKLSLRGGTAGAYLCVLGLQ